MRSLCLVISLGLLLVLVVSAGAKVDAPRREFAAPALISGGWPDEIPVTRGQPARLDTIDFGFYEIRSDGQPYAVRGGMWTWDHGAADPLEGWVARDVTVNIRDYWRQMTQARWIAEGNPMPWPQITGAGLALCGASQDHTDTLGWAAGIGYGNDWCQRLTSPTLVYDGTGTVDLQFAYFNDTEADFDYTRVYLVVAGNPTLLNTPGFSGRIGVDTLGAVTPRTWLRTIQNADFGGGTASRNFTLRIEFRSDGNLSDEDGVDGFDCFYGPVGVDDLSISGANLVPPVSLAYNFDADLQGWSAGRCPGIGSYMGLAPLTAYNLLDPCLCELAGQVMKFHDASMEHPEDQHEQAWSPIIDRAGDIGDPLYLDYNQIRAEWDVYADLPQTNGVMYRSGWSYYPYENPNLPGVVGWSPRMGIDRYYYIDGGPVCALDNNVGTDWGLPPQCRKVRFIYEILAGCDNFGIDPCSGVTNFTPIIDNLRVRNIGVPNAPAIGFESGTQFQDGFGQSVTGILSTTDPGNADITRNTRVSPAPARLGDSLLVRGPSPTPATNWESTLWFRLRRAGPGQMSVPRYQQWRSAMMAKGIDFTTGPRPAFTWGYMDSVEVNGTPQRYRFCSQFRDGPSSGGGFLPADPCFNWGGGGEQGEGNEILPDLCFVPGTQVEYFVTSNYTCLPVTRFYLPDTTGAFFNEFEILPSFRLVDGVSRFPCVLYVDAFNRGGQYYIENALNVVLAGAGSGQPIANPARWDRYDYQDAASNWHAAFYRDAGGNNGATIPQMLGYRLILFSTGTFGTGCTWSRDWQALQQWVDAVICDGNAAVQGLILDGTAAAGIIDYLYPALLSQTLGAFHRCAAYNEAGCPGSESENDENYCVQLDPVPGAPLAVTVPTDVIANWCPPKIPYAVLGNMNSGVGSRQFVNVTSGEITQFAQVVNDLKADPRRFRTVLNAFSYHLLTERDLELAGDPREECPLDSASRVTAAYDEIAAAIRWSLDIGDPRTLGLCVEPGNCGTDAPETEGAALVNRLYPNQPNPFNPRTVIRYSLAAAGTARLEIYDAQGRKVKTLVDGHRPAGLHEVVWDRTNDAGTPVASGVFWSQLAVGDDRSSRKMVLLK